MNYENIDEGKVIIVTNFRFEDGKLDHAWNAGRPCLILFSDDEYVYILPIKSDIKKSNSYNKIPIDKKSFEYFNERGYNDRALNTFIPGTNHVKITGYMKKDISGYVNLEHVFKIPVAYRNEIGKIKKNLFDEIINKLHNIQKTKTEEDLTKKAYFGK